MKLRSRAPMRVVLAASVLFVLAGGALAQQSPPEGGTAASEKGTMLLTIFLKHDQSKPLDDINAQLRRQGYFAEFPPPGVEIVSWYVMMGIGQVVTIRFPAEQLRAVNRAIERTAWGPYRTEFYPTYDYKPAAEAERAKP
ncbi:MAG: hypothetical protein JO010_06900 [Alphaproteobacteria bacterium]|nr:hypothetical protein [Alphaproteobacteria bacterium]